MRLYDLLGRLVATVPTAMDVQTIQPPYSGTFLIQVGAHPSVKVTVLF